MDLRMLNGGTSTLLYGIFERRCGPFVVAVTISPWLMGFLAMTYTTITPCFLGLFGYGNCNH